MNRCPQLVDFLGGVLDLFDDGILLDVGGRVWEVLYDGLDPEDAIEQTNYFQAGGER